MTGLTKGKEYDWKDSNMALFGSDLEKNVKKESAEGEPAWEGAGQEVGLQIWRIVQFKVTHWPKEDYGDFFDGDSYILLHTYKKDPKSEELSYDVHFWIGEHSTQDEYGTAAYKTVELDNFLDDKPIQHREVQGHESDLFKSYFETLSIIKGGAETGFRRVLPEDYAPRMFHVRRDEKKKFSVTEVGLLKKNLKDSDVFIIDLGTTIYQWTGAECSPFEKNKAGAEVQKLEADRNRQIETIILERQTSASLPAALESILQDGEPRQDVTDDAPTEKVLYKLSDASGNLEFSEVSRGSAVSKSQLNPKDVFILDSGKNCYVWCGSEASVDERRKCMQFAHKYLMKTSHPFLHVACVKEGCESKEFHDEF